MGLGPIGLAMTGRVGRAPDLELVGAVDVDPKLVGRDVGTLRGGKPSGVVIRDDVEQVGTEIDLVLHTTGSFLPEVAPQLLSLVQRGLHVVSTCEELAYPFYRHPQLAEQLNDAAVVGGAVLLGTGINPGFVMDKFVVTALAACSVVRHVRVTRVVDAGTRRESFQRKIAAGETPEAFEKRKRGGKLGHIGLAESAHMVADAIGLSVERVLRRELGPVIADTPRETEFLSIGRGQVAGIDETVAIDVAGEERVRMELQMYVGAERPRDAVAIDGSPPFETECSSGIAGDEGTVNVVAACATRVRELQPGLRTMLDVPLKPSLVGS